MYNYTIHDPLRKRDEQGAKLLVQMSEQSTNETNKYNHN